MATYTTDSVPCTGVDTSTGLSEFAGRVIFEATTDTSANQTVITSWRFEIYIIRPAYVSHLTATSNNKVSVKFGNYQAFYSENARTVYMENHYESVGAKQGSLGPLVLASGSTANGMTPITIQHDENGNGSVDVYASYNKNLAYIQSITVSQNKAFPKIPRSAAVDSVTSVDLGGYPTIKWTPANTNYWYKVSYILGNNSVDSGSTLLKPDQAAQYTYNSLQIPTSWANSITNSRTATVTAKLETFSDSAGTTSIGSNTKAFTVTVPNTSTYQPTAALSLTDVNKFNAYFIQGRTYWNYSCGATYKNGATLGSYTLTVTDSSGGLVYSYTGTSATGTIPAINVAGIAIFNLVVTDSRGLSGSDVQAAEIKAYSKPSITASGVRGTGTVSGTSCNDFEMNEADGTVIKISYDASYTPYLTGNSLVVEVTAPNSNPVTVSSSPAYFSPYSVDNPYDFVVSAYDTISGADDASSVTVKIAPAWFPIDFRKDGKGGAFGGVASDDYSRMYIMDSEWSYATKKYFQSYDGTVKVKLFGTITVTGSSLTMAEVITDAIQEICTTYPNASSCRFMGWVYYSGNIWVDIYIASTSSLDSDTDLPYTFSGRYEKGADQGGIYSTYDNSHTVVGISAYSSGGVLITTCTGSDIGSTGHLYVRRDLFSVDIRAVVAVIPNGDQNIAPVYFTVASSSPSAYAVTVKRIDGGSISSSDSFTVIAIPA